MWSSDADVDGCSGDVVELWLLEPWLQPNLILRPGMGSSFFWRQGTALFALLPLLGILLLSILLLFLLIILVRAGAGSSSDYVCVGNDQLKQNVYYNT